MHNSGLVHCDLHLGNILVKRTWKSRYRYYKTPTNCICDFGLSQPANISSSIRSSGIYGVVPYIAPEIFRGKPYTPASDIYSLGIIIWAIHSLEQPYNGRCHDAKLILDIIGGLRPKISLNMGMANFCEELVKKCWDPDPINRPTADQIIRTMETNGMRARPCEPWAVAISQWKMEPMLWRKAKKRSRSPKALVTGRQSASRA